MHAREQRPPPNADPLEWFLLTTLPVTDVHEATRLLKWYALRWRIEDYFRILKSGCRIEELQHRTARAPPTRPPPSRWSWPGASS